MRNKMYKAEYIPILVGCLVGILLMIGISSRLFPMKEVASFFLMLSFLFVLSFDIKTGAFKKKETKFPFKYFVWICLFSLVSIS